MAAITSAGTGNWDSTTPNAPWPSGIVPVSGDTVTISSGHTITVPSGYTAVCGTSPTNNSGTVALTINGPLVVNGTLKFQGPVRQGNATVTVGAGGTVTYDATGAGTPASAGYVWEMASGSNQTNAKIVCNGTSGSHCTFNSASNTPGGIFGINSTNWADIGRFVASYTDFSYLGSSSNDFIKARLTSSVGVFTLDHCTVDNCGQISNTVTDLSADCTFQLLNTKITNPANTSFSVQLNCGIAKTTGTREIKNCDIAGRVYILLISGAASGFVVKHSICRPRSITAAAVNEAFNWTGGGTASAWDQNFAFLASNDNVADPCLRVPAGTCTNTYVCVCSNPSRSNAHPIYLSTVGGNATYSGWVLHYLSGDVNSDWFQFAGADASVTRALVFSNNLFLAGATGDVLGSLYNNDGGNTQPNTKITFDHNTICGANEVGANAFGVSSEAAQHCFPAGAVPSIRSNIKYSATSKAGTIAQTPDFGGVRGADADAITAADYNCVYNISTSIYAGNPAGQFAGTPGTHDITADPQFVDSSRSLLSFDQGYLGNAVGTAWANGVSYSVGDVVSASTSTFFGGATYNFRCVSAHTSATATDKPGSGSAWVAKWEPAAVKLISDDIIAGNTYSGGTNSLIGELVAWVKAGFAPQNVSLQNAGHDSVTIGAVEFAAIAYTHTMSGGASLGGSASPAFAATKTMSGDAVLGGAASVAQSSSFSVTMSGGVASGGSSTVSFAAAPPVSGGPAAGGGATTIFAATLTSSGGAVLGGAASVNNSSNFAVTMSGGASLDGAAGVLWTSTHGMTGGAVVGGHATVSITSFDVLDPGGVFRRVAGLSRVFRRAFGLSRVFKRNPAMATILLTSLPKDSDESIAYIFDFSQFDEAKAGETIASGDVPAVSGLTIGSASVLSADTNFVPATLGVKVSISGGTPGTTYGLECRGTFSGGAIRVVKGQLVVE